jgi:uncharacterized membrane protein YtjA (UPF0391 family)
MMNKRGQAGWAIWAILFFIGAVVAGLFGFGIISGVSFVIAKWLVVIFAVLLVISIVARVVKNA